MANRVPKVVELTELKAQLGAYVTRASSGEVFLLTKFGRLVATLAPPSAGRAYLLNHSTAADFARQLLDDAMEATSKRGAAARDKASG